MIYKNIRQFDNLEFNDYLKLDGLGFSSLKGMRDGVSEAVQMTEKIKLGKIVDDIMTNKGRESGINDDLYTIALKISTILQSQFGNIFGYMQTQVSYQADIEHEGMVMRTTGRLDYMMPKRLVLDLKVNHSIKTYSDAIKLIEWMKYDCQIFHYSELAEVAKRFILIYSTKVNDTFLIPITDITRARSWWESKVLENGLWE